MRPFETPYGDFLLQCSDKSYPQSKDMQAWNQADSYLLNISQELLSNIKHGNANGEKDKDSSNKLAIINDHYGALAAATESFAPAHFSDSAVLQYWLNQNCQSQQEIQSPDKLSDSSCNVFLMRLPKNLHYFSYQLEQLSLLSKQQPNIIIYVAGMQKHWPATFYKMAEQYFDIEVHPGIKKAKCMTLTSNANKHSSVEKLKGIAIPELQIKLSSLPNVYSREKLDLGARFFLENFPNLNDCQHIIDLACGNGVLGIKAMQLNPHINVNFVDESAYAIESCKINIEQNNVSTKQASFYHNNVLYGLEALEADAILCNPPFHDQHGLTEITAAIMAKQGYNALKSGGKLYWIGNRHLQYHKLLRQYFTVDVMASNSKFVMYQAIKD